MKLNSSYITKKITTNFSKGYDLEGLSEVSEIDCFFQKYGKDYAKGIIKRFKDENFLKKYFTKLYFYNKYAKEYLNLNYGN